MIMKSKYGVTRVLVSGKQTYLEDICTKMIAEFGEKEETKCKLIYKKAK